MGARCCETGSSQRVYHGNAHTSSVKGMIDLQLNDMLDYSR